jgi:hypothetical protein
MDNIYNLVGSEYVQVHSPQVGEIHGLDAGASGYISLVDTLLTNKMRMMNLLKYFMNNQKTFQEFLLS